MAAAAYGHCRYLVSHASAFSEKLQDDIFMTSVSAGDYCDLVQLTLYLQIRLEAGQSQLFNSLLLDSLQKHRI